MEISLKLPAIVSVITALLCASSVLAAVPHTQWTNSLAPKGPRGAELTLARRGLAQYQILIPKDATTQESKAAADLSDWLRQITSASFAVVKESGATAPEGRFISIGKTRLLRESGLSAARAKLGDEGYAVDEKDRNLFLLGGATRGPINAVYAFLEEDLGCRWYSRFSQTLPSSTTLKVRPVKRRYVPALDIRDPYYWEAFDGGWSLRNRTNAPDAKVPMEWGGHKRYALFVHTFGMLVPPAKYFEEHPDYFSEHNGKRDTGQLCFSSPGAIAAATETTKRILKDNPDAQIISVSQNDSVPCCECEKCKAAAAAEGSYSGPLLQFVNAVAADVEKDFPKVTVSTLAYLDTAVPPKTVRPRRNVAIQLCTDVSAWPEPFLTIEETEAFQARMKAWAAMGARIHVWDYTVNFSHYPGPMPNWQVVTDSIRFFVKHNAAGVMLQGNYQTPGTADGFMRTWVWAKQLWDPSRDTQSLMKDFVYGYYGKAAPAIWEYQELLWNLWEKEHQGKLKTPQGGIRYPMSLFDDAFLRAAKDCFQRAARAGGDAETLRRVEEAELQILYAYVSREAESGKPSDPAGFREALDRFEKIGRRIRMTHTREGAPDFEEWMTKMRALAGP